ncbi:pPIWI_RE module domain-containing protein [Scytonema sp. NUACC26]|uniref:pPIWI_RE module domain-containing protein n=1 Tax=Scytonema sp. NUACC26 TaxID=3140176 RepID=UPI0034DC0253
MASKPNSIQLFALQVPAQISLPFKLYSLIVPQDWKKLLNKLQQRKNGKSYISLPVECLNHALQLLLDDEILFPSKNAFKLTSNANWLYTKTDNVSTNYIANVVKTWLRISLQNAKDLTEADIAEINSLSGDDLHFEEVQLPEKVWELEDGQLKINPLYYNLIPYLLASAIASEPLKLIDPTTGKVFKEVVFRSCAVDNGDVAELISWAPELEIKEVTNKETSKKNKTTHNYSYLINFALHYTADGKPYVSCNYGIRRWVNWELGFLSSRVTVYVSPTNSTRFAPCQLKFVKKKKDAHDKKNGDKKKNIDFEGHLARLISELNFRDKFTALEVINNPCKQDDLAWGIVYNNTMSHSHNAGAGLFPQDIEIFYNCCREKIQKFFGDAFPTIETYTRCDNKQAVEKTSTEYKALGKFIKSHFAVESEDIPFYIPPDLRLILLSQTTASNKLIHALASKYSINMI